MNLTIGGKITLLVLVAVVALISEQNSSATEELSSTSEELAKAADELLGMADELGKIVGQFKIDGTIQKQEEEERPGEAKRSKETGMVLKKAL